MASGAHVALRHMIANYPRMTALSRSLTFSLTEEGVWLVKAASLQQCVDVMMDSNYYGTCVSIACMCEGFFITFVCNFAYEHR